MSTKQDFSFVSSYVAGTGDCILYIKNESDDCLVFSSILVGSAVDNKFNFKTISSGTAAGTLIEGTAHDLGNGSAKTSSEIKAYGNAAVTGLTPDSNIVILRTAAHTSSEQHFTSDEEVDEKIYLETGFSLAVYAEKAGDVEVSLYGGTL